MERSVIRGGTIPDYAALHPGYKVDATIGDVEPARYYFCTLIRTAAGRDCGGARQWSGGRRRHRGACRTCAAAAAGDTAPAQDSMQRWRRPAFAAGVRTDR